MSAARLEIHRLHERDAGLPFAWGTADCLVWCADVAEAITGRDPAAHLRGRYKTAAGARRIMKAKGWASMADVASSMLDEIPVALARAGDWAWIEATDTLGVVMGEIIVARTEQLGLGQSPLTHAARAWRLA